MKAELPAARLPPAVVVPAVLPYQNPQTTNGPSQVRLAKIALFLAMMGFVGGILPAGGGIYLGWVALRRMRAGRNLDGRRLAVLAICVGCGIWLLMISAIILLCLNYGRL